jgi:hypothetical protein
MISKAAIPAFHALLVREMHDPHFSELGLSRRTWGVAEVGCTSSIWTRLPCRII